ncbi:LacI family DNA-binding transcriptional regulator [Coraliomargarita parva]|uniref:LacI family DNA-binding transcriptional regulator n=1 Tax=Coraliomargarita parva TaxID=3014050 RepID=UPI0022B5CEE5|nr:LacI family DNA-binding transcriptional regulator [Coraliomargarita parva]
MGANIREIANAAGVSTATVSRALRGLARVEPATRERVLAAAEKLGYSRDPLLSAALSRARHSKTPNYRETIGVLSETGLGKRVREEWSQRIWTELVNCSKRMGYAIESFVLPESAKSQLSLIRQLHARGIRGLVLPPKALLQHRDLVPEWGRFAVVEISHPLVGASFPRVQRLFQDDMAQLLRQLHVRGYRRIGLALNQVEELRRGEVIIASTLLYTRQHPELLLSGVLYEDGYAYDATGLVDWLEARKPDVIIANGANCYDWLNDAGFHFPDDLGLCRIDAMRERPESGLAVNYEAIARMAIVQLASRLEHDSSASVMPNAVVGIPSDWVEGTTLKRLS